MKRRRFLTFILFTLLIGTNIFLAAALFDVAITNKYMTMSLNDNKGGLDQAIAIIPILPKPNYTRQEVIEAARAAYHVPDIDMFEKEGFVWVGNIGLKFDENDKLVEIKRSWSFVK